MTCIANGWMRVYPTRAAIFGKQGTETQISLSHSEDTAAAVGYL